MKFFKNKEGKGMLILGCDCAIDAPNGYVELVANTTDAAQEKHVPVVKATGDTVLVDVGSVAHPMTEEHSIKFIALQTTDGYQFRKLSPTDAPKAEFKLASGAKPIAAYEYCNLHGLWVYKF